MAMLGYLSGLLYIAAAFLLFLAGKLAYDFHRKSYNLNAELLERDNLAVALALSGYFIGLTLAVGGALAGTAPNLVRGLLSTLIYGVIAIVLFNVSIRLNEWLIFTDFSLKKELITDRNCGVGLVVAASHVAQGLILYGVIAGEGGGPAALLVFWALGQITLILAVKVYGLIIPYRLDKVMEQDNVAVGAALAGMLLALGNLVRVAVQGNFGSWAQSLISFALVALASLILLPLLRLAIDKLIMTPGHSLTQEQVGQKVPNIGAGVLEGSLYLCLSLLIGWCL